MMNTSEAEDRLYLGIEAMKTGHRDKVRELLIEIVGQDEENEQAWLWLSSAVDTDEDKRVCFENILTLNPKNQVAQKGLAKLGDSTTPSRQTVHREITPPNLAGAILYPERHNQEWEWHDPTPDRQVITNPEVVQESSYKDIWERDDELCAFCAQELVGEESTCPRCEKGLITRTYRYPQPDTNLHNLWVMLVAIGQLYLLQAI